jgi:hypothetical protein
MPRLSQWLDDVNPNDLLSLIERLLLGELLRDTGGELPRSECFRLWRILLTAILESDSRAGAGSEEKAVGADTAPPKSPQVAETQVAPDHTISSSMGNCRGRRDYCSRSSQPPAPGAKKGSVTCAPPSSIRRTTTDIHAPVCSNVWRSGCPPWCVLAPGPLSVDNRCGTRS